MSRIKQLSRNAVFAWSPRIPGSTEVLLAAGTSAGHFDASFDSAAVLEICRLDLGDANSEMAPIASIPVPHRMHCVEWIKWGMGEGGAHPQGVVMTGYENGTVGVFDVQKLLSKQKADIVQLKGHTSHVQTVEGNEFKWNLMATGAGGSEIYIWDLLKPQSPMAPGPKQQPSEHVVAVRWSPQVEHILGSLSTGKAHIWDLRKNDGPILTLGDLGPRVQWKGMRWHPESATALILASEDDNFPVLQTWDVRFASAPLAQLDAHTKGILSVDWCPADPDLLVTAAKDMKIYLWNPNTSQWIGELPLNSRTWGSQVRWCPGNPNLIGVGSGDCRVGIYSILGGSSVDTSSPALSPKLADSFPGADFSHVPQPSAAQKQREDSTAALKLPQVPKWLRPGPCGARFSFGNRLVTFSPPPPQDPAQPQTPVQHSVTLSQVVTDDELVRRAGELESSLGSGGVGDLCDARLVEAKDEETRLLWSFLKAHASGAGRREYGRSLGLSSAKERLTSVLGDPASWKIGPPEVEYSESEPEGSPSKSVRSDSVDQLGESVRSASLRDSECSEPLVIPTDPSNWEGLLTQSILAGDMESAVEICVRKGDWADAFQVAMAGGTEVFERLQRYYCEQMTKEGRGTSRMIALLTGQRWRTLIECVDIRQWRELLGFMLSFAPSEEFGGLCGRLSERMRGEASVARYASLASVAAGNVDALADALDAKNPAPVHAMGVVEAGSVLRWSLGGGSMRVVRVGPNFASALSTFAEELARQGALGTAAFFLSDVPEESVAEKEELALLRDRVFEAAGMNAGKRQPRPFQIQSIGQTLSAYGGGQKPAGPGNWRRDSVPAGPQGFGGSGSSNYSNYSGNGPSHSASNPAGYYSSAGPYGAPQPNYAAPAPAQQPMGPPPTAPIPSAPSSTGSRSRYPSSSVEPTYNTNFTPAPTYGFNPGNVANQPLQPPPGGAAPGGRSPPPVAAVAPRPAGNYTPGWNDPPPLGGPSRRKPPSQPAPVPAPVTMPVMGGHVAPQAPPTSMNYGAQHPPSSTAYARQPPANAQPTHYGSSNQRGMRNGNWQAPGFVPNPSAPSTPPPVQEVAKEVVAEPPIPGEDQVIPATLDAIAERILAHQPSGLIRKRVTEAQHRFQTELYARLRYGQVSAGTLSALHQLVGMMGAGDWDSALGAHTALANGYDFAAISPFMPSLKALLQTARSLRLPPQ